MAEIKVEFESMNDTLIGMLFMPNLNQKTGQHGLPAFIFCHGATDYKEHFFEFCRYLSSLGYATLALDMHGHGESGGDRYHVKMEYWSKDLSAAYQFLSLQPDIDAERIGAFGFSSGGTAVLTAVLAGVPFKTIVLLDATVRNVVSNIEATMLTLAGRFGKWKNEHFGSDLHIPLYPFALMNDLTHDKSVGSAFVKEDYFKRAYYRYPLPGAIESLVVNLLPQLGDVNIPVCVLHGEEDQLDSPDTAKLLFDALSGEKALHIIPNNGHMGHLDMNKEEVMQVTEKWIEKYL